MALTIVVRSGDSESPPRITFDAPRIVIGRGEGCEVRLPDPSVSHRHASIRQRGSDYIVVDEGSTNGTFVGPVKLAPQATRLLKSGDRVRVGRVWLEVLMEPAPATEQPQLATKELALGLVASALKAQGQDAQLTVTVVDGPDKGLELALTGFRKRYVVGRGLGADLQVGDQDASRRHAELERRGDRVQVKDLGSKNGSKLEDDPIRPGHPVLWKPGQTLQLGANRLCYRDPLTAALDDLESAVDEPMEDFDVPELPGESVPDLKPGAVLERDSSDAPIGEVPERPRPPPTKRRLLNPDVLVALFALLVLVLSGLGLFWLFSGP